MDLNLHRDKFSILILDSEDIRARLIQGYLEDVGYSCEHMASIEDLGLSVAKVLPDIVILHYDDKTFFNANNNHAKLIMELQAVSPRIRLIFLSSAQHMKFACELYQYDIFDIVQWPASHPMQLVRSLDRAIAYNHYSQVNNSMIEAIEDVESGTETFGLFSTWLKTLQDSFTIDSHLTAFMNEATRISGLTDCAYLHYVHSKKSLVLKKCLGLAVEFIDELGVDLEQDEPGFREEMLGKPNDLVSLKAFVNEALNRNHVVFYPFIVKGKILGIFAILSVDPIPTRIKESGYLQACLRILDIQMRCLEMAHTMEEYLVVDPMTGVLNSEALVAGLNEEVSRSRRIKRAVSVLYIGIDDVHNIFLQYADEKVDSFIKAFADVLVKNSRVNDLVGRIDRDHFLLCLPHTDQRGAVIKAERLRRIYEGADFSAVLGRPVHVTVSIGISVYPDFTQNGESLLQSAEKAFFQIRKTTKNKICLATQPAHFIPDFTPVEIGPDVSTHTS